MLRRLLIKCNRSFTSRPFEVNFGTYDIVKPEKVTSSLLIDDDIKVPQQLLTPAPVIRSSHAIQKMKNCCKTARYVLDFATSLVEVGLSTNEIDEAVHKLCMSLKVYPSPLHYKGFPKSICTSVNNVVCHGIPDQRPLVDGDIINIDITVYQDGYHGDCSRTVLVGNVDSQGRQLVEATEAALQAGINACRDGRPFGVIGAVVEQEAEKRGFNIVPSVTGHGIGEQFHEPPDVYHLADNPETEIMRVGMTFTIEPALTQGSPEIEILEDGWTAVTVDGARSAQAEHTVLITENGAQVLTDMT